MAPTSASAWSRELRTLMLMPTPSGSADVRQPLAHTRTRLGRSPRAARATARSSWSGAGRVLRRGAELHREGDPAGATRVLDHVGAPLCRVKCARRFDGEGAQRRIDSGRQGSDEIVGTESRAEPRRSSEFFVAPRVELMSTDRPHTISVLKMSARASRRRTALAWQRQRGGFGKAYVAAGAPYWLLPCDMRGCGADGSTCESAVHLCAAEVVKCRR